MLILETALDQGSPTVRKLFRSWDSDVFGSSLSPLGGDGHGEVEEREEEVDDAMQQIADDIEDAGNTSSS